MALPKQKKNDRILLKFSQPDLSPCPDAELGILIPHAFLDLEDDLLDDDDEEEEEEEEEVEEDQDYEFPIGPMPQHITNDLKSLDEMVSLFVSQYCLSLYHL